MWWEGASLSGGEGLGASPPRHCQACPGNPVYEEMDHPDEPGGDGEAGCDRPRRGSEEVEAIWDPIDESDDWGMFHSALAEIAVMREAYG